MADLRQDTEQDLLARPVEAPETGLPGFPGGPGLVPEQPLWRIRLRLLWKSLRSSWGMFRENVLGIIGLVVIAIFGVLAVAHPIMMTFFWDSATYDPITGYDAPTATYTVVPEVTDPLTEISQEAAMLRGNVLAQPGDEIVVPRQPAPPSAKHWLGTDPNGRDIMSQLMFGARAAFLLGAIAALVTAVVATTVGSVAAYFGGWVDSFFMRLADLILLLPALAILIVLSTLWNFTLIHLALVLGIFSGFGATAIILKSQALSVKVKPFVDAARVAGGSHFHIIVRHIIPNVVPLSFLYMMFEVTAAISIEATLSFFGLLNIPMSWGIMINIAQTQGFLLSGTEFWWLLLPPGLAVTLLAAAFYLVGRAMDEIINPRLRSR